MTMWASPDEDQEPCPLPNFMCGGVGVPVDPPEGATVYPREKWFRCRKCATTFHVYRSDVA